MVGTINPITTVSAPTSRIHRQPCFGTGNVAEDSFSSTPEIDRIVQVPEASRATIAANDPFVGLVKKATQMYLDDVERKYPGLKADMIKNGFGVWVVDHSGEGITHELIASIPIYREEFEKLYQNFHLELENYEKHSSNEMVKAYRVFSHSEPDKMIMDDSTIRDFLIFWISKEGSGKTAAYDRGRNKIIIPKNPRFEESNLVQFMKNFLQLPRKRIEEQLGKERAHWKNLTENPEILARVICHEGSHFISQKLGEKYMPLEKQFSTEETFRHKSWEEQEKAIASGLLPGKEESTDIGMVYGNYRPRDTHDNDKRFEENFAEILSAEFIGGAINPDLIRQVYQETLDHLRKLVLDRYR